MTADEKKRMNTLENGQARILDKLELIYGEVKRTNGRVTKLEDGQVAIQSWQKVHEEYTRNKLKEYDELNLDVDKLKESNAKRMGANVVLYFFAGIAGAVAVALIQYFLMKN